MEKIKIFACNTAEKFTEEICENLELKPGKITFMKFKNDNTFVQYQETVREHDIYLIQTTQPPVNERIMELLIAIDAAKRAGARRINVVLPYYMYSRSDKKDQPRIPVTAKLFAQLLEAAGADRVITCDLHNSAIQAYFNIECVRITERNIFQKYLKDKNFAQIVVVAPDAGSVKKAHRYSHFFNCPIALVDKRREGNEEKAIATNVVGDVKDKTAIIFDDEVETAGTLIEAAHVVKKAGAKDIYVACTHGLLVGPAIERIKQSDIKELIITNTIPISKEKKIDKIKILSIAGLFAEAIKRCNEGLPLGDLFDL